MSKKQFYSLSRKGISLEYTQISTILHTECTRGSRHDIDRMIWEEITYYRQQVVLEAGLLYTGEKYLYEYRYLPPSIDERIMKSLQEGSYIQGMIRDIGGNLALMNSGSLDKMKINQVLEQKGKSIVKIKEYPLDLSKEELENILQSLEPYTKGALSLHKGSILSPQKSLVFVYQLEDETKDISLEKRGSCGDCPMYTKCDYRICRRSF